MVMRGEVWLATLDPTIGSEIQKTRPCIVISPPEMGLILLDQIRTLDKTRLQKKLGAVSGKTLFTTLNVLQDIFAK